MPGIPPALDSDAEDVVWALQTADTLWKRRERVDAIVWLRRAAQAAGEADDDDRALALARDAAELADYIARNPQSIPPRSAPPPEVPTTADAVDDLLQSSRPEALEDAALTVPSLPIDPSSVPLPSWPLEAPPASDESVTGVRASLHGPTEPVAARVPTAAEAHAGMLDPWAEGEAPTKERQVPLRPAAPPAPPFDAEEVITSAPSLARRAPAPEQPPPREAAGVDISGVEELSDLPDDARTSFALAATVREVGPEEEVSGFALALVLSGSVDLTATIVDAPAQRLEAGAVMRARGTIDHVAPVRLVGVSEKALVATWDEHAVQEAFRTCPWVEDDLRAAGDRLQAMVGATMGPLGERLDPFLRAEVTSRLSLRALAEHEIFASRGDLIPGLLVVGAGELELVDDQGTPDGTVLRPGDFLFPNEVLSHSPAPSTVRAASGGALILFADRNVAQELLVTCPPLLEIFAGG